jgi:chromosome segregation ATPase
MTVRPGSIPGNVPLLMPLHGPGDRRPRPLDRDVSTIGRARGCTVCLEASDVSTVHCIVFRSSTGYQVRDCSSRAGTRVNGDAIRADRALRDGDILQVGPFSFEVQMPAALVEASPAHAVALVRCQHSRRRLAEHALRLRRLLREHAGSGRAAEVQHELARAREKACVLERRMQELNEADRELETEREELRARVQQVEGDIARRLEEVEEQVRQRWQEFQRRCQAEEAALAARAQQQSARQGEGSSGPARKGAEEPAPQPAVDRQQHQLARQLEALHSQRQELESMRQRFDTEHAAAQGELDQQRAALAQQESALRSQRTELALADCEARLAESAAGPDGERALNDAHSENELLRTLLQDRERELDAARKQRTGSRHPVVEAAADVVEPLRSENALLKQQLSELDALVVELRASAAPRPARSANELERYESELNQERQELERDRTKFTTELEQLRVRNQELDEATREMEMEMSRERAELARERIRMERMREELKVDTEKLQREMSMRESLAPVQRLRDEINQKRPGGKSIDPAADRLRQLRSNNDTPRT